MLSLGEIDGALGLTSGFDNDLSTLMGVRALTPQANGTAGCQNQSPTDLDLDLKVPSTGRCAKSGSL